MRCIQKSAFTIVELLISSASSALLLIFMMFAVQKILDQKQRENFKCDLLEECYQILNLLERDWEQKTISVGNFLLREPSYPVIYTRSKPKLMFFRDTPEGPQLVCYAIGTLPKNQNIGLSGEGLLQATKSVEESKVIFRDTSERIEVGEENYFSDDEIFTFSNLISENIVDLTVIPMEFDPDDQKWIPLTTKSFTVDRGVIGSEGQEISNTRNLGLSEVTVIALANAQQAEYKKCSNDDARRDFLRKNGVRMTRVMPWYL
ncbi:MAG: hypothetical protein LW808_003815 [Verrucomicrobiota bacterium]|nr:MAG: hypothetical protein LW808_003815 [Verrucomicrobiota bacterium]